MGQTWAQVFPASPFYAALYSLTIPLRFRVVTNLQNVIEWGPLVLLFTGKTTSGHSVPWRSGAEHLQRETLVMNG